MPDVSESNRVEGYTRVIQIKPWSGGTIRSKNVQSPQHQNEKYLKYRLKTQKFRNFRKLDQALTTLESPESKKSIVTGKKEDINKLCP